MFVTASGNKAWIRLGEAAKNKLTSTLMDEFQQANRKMVKPLALARVPSNGLINH